MSALGHIALFIAIGFLMTGCSNDVLVKLDARLPLRPAHVQTPLRLGVYYSPEFLSYTKKIEFACSGERYGVFYVYPIGAASKDLFDQIASGMFTSVSRISDPSQSTSHESSIDGVLEPHIESFTWKCLRSKPGTRNRIVADIRYMVNLYDPSGQIVESIRVAGSGFEILKLCFSDCRDSFATEQAMQDAMSNFMLGFCKHTEIKRWSSTHGALCGEQP